MKILDVLIVEDEPSNREIAEVILTNLGHRVVSCDSGQAALDICLKEGRRFDLVLMDVLTPVLDGLKATRELRAHDETKEMAIICVSAKASGSDEAAGLQAGCDAYLRKPYRRKDLLSCINEVLARRGILAPGERLGE